jgi:hypothetical protein
MYAALGDSGAVWPSPPYECIWKERGKTLQSHLGSTLLMNPTGPRIFPKENPALPKIGKAKTAGFKRMGKVKLMTICGYMKQVRGPGLSSTILEAVRRWIQLNHDQKCA